MAHQTTSGQTFCSVAAAPPYGLYQSTMRHIVGIVAALNPATRAVLVSGGDSDGASFHFVIDVGGYRR